MKELLINACYKMISSCSCGGTYVEKYKKLTKVFEIKPNRKVWSLKVNGVFQSKGTADNINEFI